MAPKAGSEKTNGISDTLSLKLDNLNSILKKMESVLVAYSGGVDSTFLLKVATDVLPGKAHAVIGKSPTLPASELASAVEFAQSLGHSTKQHSIRVVETDEMTNPDFVANPPDRCFHCKSVLFRKLGEVASEIGVTQVVEGSNLSDESDYRPGFGAVEKYGIRSPLREAKLTKEDIRVLSKTMDLPTWNKPAAPCLSSRVPYGSVITLEKLSRIEAAEEFLRSLGFKTLRVRDHEQVARIEIPTDDFQLLMSENNVATIITRFKALGYTWVTLDIEGFRSGSLNETLDTKTDG